MTDRVGQQLGNYRLIHRLGEGGFAEVYLGEHVYLKTQAAVKVLLVRLAGDNLEDFLTEARTVAGLKHPHIVRVLDFGVESNTPFLVMDYASNGTLRQYHPRGSRVPLTSVLTYVRQVATALQYAHDKRLVHRDVKPENMLLGPDDEVLLSDFGIAVIAQSTRYGSTQEVAGTVAYMAPEQIQGKPRPSSDQYSLGVVVYEWLSGDRPFHGSFAEIASQHMFAPPAPLYEKVPSIPQNVEHVVLTALEKDPYRRFGSVLAFANALEQARHGESFSVSGYSSTFISPIMPDSTLYSARPTEPPKNVTASPSPSSPAQTDAPGTRRISRRKIILGLASLTVVGGGIAALLHSQGASVLSHTPGSTATIRPHSMPTNTANATRTTASTSTPTRSPQPTRALVITRPFIYRGHSDQVYTVAWSPDGTRIASGGRGDIIQIWDATSGKLILVYHGNTAKVYSVAWSPDNLYVASGHYDGMVQIWNASTGNLRFTYRGHSSTYRGGPNWINAVAWSPDGTRIASASHDTTVQVCDATNGNQLFTYQGHSSDVEGVAWSPNGLHIASGGLDDSVQVWSTATGTLGLNYHHPGGVDAVAWSHNGAYIASGGGDTSVRVWNAANGNTLLTYRGHSDVVQSVAWSPDSRYVASASNDMTVQICSVA